MERFFPITDPVVIIALVAGLIVTAPILLEKKRVPGMVGLLLAGAILGPNALGVLERDRSIELLGTVGLLYIMFTAALEIDLVVLRRTGNRSLTFGALTFAIPQTLGTLVARFAFGFEWTAAVLLGSLFASHTLLAYPIVSRLGLTRNAAVTTALGGTILTDTAALLVLAIVAGAARGTLSAAFWIQLSLSIAIYVAGVLLLLPRFVRWFFRSVRPDGTSEFAFVLAMVFGTASLSHVAGVEPIVGAFLAGLALNRSIPHGSALMNRINFTGDAIFIPFFLLSVGMLLDVRVFGAGLYSWAVALSMVACVTVAKYLAARAAGRIFRFNRNEIGLLFGLSLAQAAATLASVMVGYDLGIFDKAVLNGAIVMMLVTCIAAPWLVDRHGRAQVLDARADAELDAVAAQRILVSLSNPDTAEPLVDLALLLRDPAQDQPIIPLTVVRDGPDAAQSVVYAEKMLARAMVHLTAADVPAQPLTRIDANIVAALRRVRTELRVTDLIMGWSGRPSAQERFFGTFLDHILSDRDHALWVARLIHPLNTTARLLFVLPPNAAREPGFVAAAKAVKVLARQVGAPLHIWVERAEADAVSHRLSRLKPAGEFKVRKLDAWSGAVPALGDEVTGLDLLVLYGSREGSLAWTPGLARLPRQVGARLPAVNTVVVYPADPQHGLDAMGLPETAPHSARTFLRPEGLVLDLDDPSHAGGPLAHLLRQAPGLDPTGLESVLQAMEAAVQPLDPGVVLLHGVTHHIQHTAVLLGLSRRGLLLEGTGGTRTHLIFVILHPTEHDPQHHLDVLAEIARRIHAPDVMELACQATDRDALWAALYRPPTTRRTAAEGLAEIPAERPQS